MLGSWWMVRSRKLICPLALKFLDTLLNLYNFPKAHCTQIASLKIPVLKIKSRITEKIMAQCSCPKHIYVWPLKKGCTWEKSADSKRWWAVGRPWKTCFSFKLEEMPSYMAFHFLIIACLQWISCLQIFFRMQICFEEILFWFRTLFCQREICSPRE